MTCKIQPENWAKLRNISTQQDLPSQLVDPKGQMLDNPKHTVHNHHSHTLLCMAEELGELLCIQISKNTKIWFIKLLNSIIKLHSNST